MSFYVAAYDTEAVFEWWEPTRSDAAGYDAYVSYEGESLETFLAGARAVAEAHLATETPATFFIVAKLLDHCGSHDWFVRGRFFSNAFAFLEPSRKPLV